VAVPAVEGRAAVGRALGARSVASGPLAAVVGPVRREGATRVALRHARIVADALAACSSVVPFRLGIELASDQEVRELLAENRADLCGRLDALAGCVEMGLKVRVPASSPDPSRLEAALRRVRALAPSAHRRELRRPVADGQVLEACYLLPRDRIEPFWAEVASLRSDTGFPVLGTGPWAPYTFSDITLRSAPRAGAGDPIQDRRPS
jgi:hypothetical protein